ncbi:hypothetical protein BD289DRAFT_256895 [Coniella lustricola]|uniref:Uncharacterized protein n=1 Tax=Coniella lustricola TaxID=2025994 RepID=A0A2T3AKZ5_9PEZI|nr:hypothetical protein BD289DRAFT_256895 [Coniella lustricola]
MRQRVRRYRRVVLLLISVGTQRREVGGYLKDGNVKIPRRHLKSTLRPLPGYKLAGKASLRCTWHLKVRASVKLTQDGRWGKAGMRDVLCSS